MLKKIVPILATLLVLTGCSTSAPETQLSSNHNSTEYKTFQEHMDNALDGILFSKDSTLVRITTDSNYDENDTVENYLYFKNGEDRFRATFMLSNVNSESMSIKSYYSSCPQVKEMFIVEPFSSGALNKYEGGKFYIKDHKAWELFVNKNGALMQYFELDSEGRLVTQKTALVAPIDSTEESLTSITAEWKNASLEKIQEFLRTTSQKTVITYEYDSYSKLASSLKPEQWLEKALAASKKPSTALFLDILGGNVSNVSSSSDGLKCVVKD